MSYVNPLLGPGDEPYSPIDPNPNVDQDAGFMNADDPNPPAGSYDPAPVAAYGAGIRVPAPPSPRGAMAAPGSPAAGLRSLFSNDLLRNAAAGAAGAVAYRYTKSKKISFDVGELVKGALASVVTIMLLRNRLAGATALAAGAGAGYAAARWIR